MSTGRLTTHVLDTHLGKPASNLTIELWRMAEKPMHLKTVVTNSDGRVESALLAGEAMMEGTYQLKFHAGAYLLAIGAPTTAPPFLDVIPIQFGIADPQQHYHVPLLLSAHGYSTYRGS